MVLNFNSFATLFNFRNEGSMVSVLLYITFVRRIHSVYRSLILPNTFKIGNLLLTSIRE